MMAGPGDVTHSCDMGSNGMVFWSAGTLATALTADKGSQWGTHPDTAEEVTQTQPVPFSSTGCQTEAMFPGLVISETKDDVLKTGVCCEKCGRFFKQKETADKHWWLNHFVSQGELLELFGGTNCSYSSDITEPVQVQEKTRTKEEARRTSPEHCPQETGRRKRGRPRHVGAYICEVCEKEFSSRRCLVTHTTTHSKEKPHVCDICQKKFYWKRQLTCHMSSHEKPHTCQLCPQRFSQKRSLVTHMKRHEALARENFHSCSVCQELFPDRGSLTDHEKSAHASTIESYACITCHEVFSEKAGLLNHQCKLIMRRMLAVASMLDSPP